MRGGWRGGTGICPKAEFFFLFFLPTESEDKFFHSVKARILFDE